MSRFIFNKIKAAALFLAVVLRVGQLADSHSDQLELLGKTFAVFDRENVLHENVLAQIVEKGVD